MYLGQHGAADNIGVIADTTSASPEEYQSMLQDLQSIGYHEWYIIKRSKPLYHLR